VEKLVISPGSCPGDRACGAARAASDGANSSMNGRGSMPYADPETQRAYQREWWRRRREKWLADKCCVNCGTTEGLQVDHIDPSTKLSHKVWSWSLERREAELAKCQVLCSFCHKAKTAAERWRPIPHGTHSGYAHHGCRCSACRAGQRVYQRMLDRRRARSLS
jgi:hypothetical protein